MRAKLVLVLLLCVLAMHEASLAHKQPDPAEFIAGITALAEQCAKRYPNMKNAPSKLTMGMNAEELSFAQRVKETPEFKAALEKARAEVAKLSTAKVKRECNALMDAPERRN